MKRTTAAVLALISIAGTSLAQTPGTTPAPAPGPAGTTSLALPKDAPPEHVTPPGPYAVTVEANPGLMTHTIYRPADLKPFTGAKRLPIIAWGNGACSNAGMLFSTFLTQVASHGFVVIASGPKDAPLPAFAGQRARQAIGAPPPAPAGSPPAPMTKDADMQTAIDWAIKQNADKASPFFGKLNPDKVAVMGQSCGGLQAIANAGDPRVKTVMVWNSGAFPPGATTRAISGATKDSLAKFHSPVAYINGGPTDVAYPNSVDDVSRIKGVPVFHAWINVGHGGTYDNPGGGWFGEVGVNWLKWRLNGDKEAAKMFLGPDCGLCKNPIWHVENKVSG